MLEKDIPDKNIFMMCEKLNKNALSTLPVGFYIRTCQTEELDIWKSFPFDTDEEKREYYQFMSNYFNDVYSNKDEEFFRKCLFVCENKTNKPVATCFIWKAYDKINTIHWFKTLKEYEGKGLGRALLSYIMCELKEEEYPIYLHTQPSSFRAIGLYSSFGFKIVTNEKIGDRENNYIECLPILKQFMKKDTFNNLEFVMAPSVFDEAARSSKITQF